MIVEIIIKGQDGGVLARTEGNAHEPIRWLIGPFVDNAAGLTLRAVYYDPDSRPLAADPSTLRVVTDRRGGAEIG